LKIFKRFLVLIGILLVLFQVPFSCAHRGTPGGGPIDTIPPVVMKTKPANYSTHFDSKIIRIDFDEYIKLKDPIEQILISPPMPERPLIRPQAQALKYVEIEIRDSLKPNTTYTINFGQSIEDNNEANPLPFYKYVFSTGDYIDSLSVSGSVKDAYKRMTDEHISVMLYKLDSTYFDSIIYKEPPAYIAHTDDNTNAFEIENIAEGEYKIFALKDKNQNYLFNPRSEKIGFLSDTVRLPSDEIYNLNIFKEEREFKADKASQESLQHLLFGFEGGIDSVEINMISDTPSDFAAAYYKQEEKDSIDYWFKPYFETDSLLFEIKKEDYRDTLIVRLKELEKDSLKIKASPTSTLGLAEYFTITANTPLSDIDKERIQILDKDSTEVPFKTKLKSELNKLIVEFEKVERQTYKIQALPGAIRDFYGEENDTLNYSLRTKAETDYADVRLTIENIAQYPVIVQMTNEAGEVKMEISHTKEEGNVFDFSFVEPGTYYVRVIYDENANGKWDTGNYLEKRQPERAIHMAKPLEVRKNWEISQTFILSE